MNTSNVRRRLSLAAVLLAATVGSAAPAYAGPADKAERCEQRLERILERFRVIEERRGYEAATEWWYKRWPKYHERCLLD
jgi:hypothetical protein